MGASKWVVALVGMLCAAPVSAQQMQIQFAEPVSLAVSPGLSTFNAHGRRFSLRLESNDRLLQALPGVHKARLQGAATYRGTVDNAPGSWVRLTRVGGTLEGAIWDGNDLYAVAPYGQVAAHLVTPLDLPPDHTVVYRFSDTVEALPRDFCGVEASLPASRGAVNTALKQYQAVVAELQRAAAAAPTDQLEISLIADGSFQSAHGANTSDAMLARLNIVDGIFASQLGVLLVPREFRLVPAGSDPFTSTQGSALLTQLATYRENTPAVRGAGLAHLMTAKDLDGNTLGIAFIDTLCEQRNGVSLSSSTLIPVSNAVVMAHELGHNFGAVHDGEPGVCAAEPQNQIMAPQHGGFATFSQCSRGVIAQSVSRARGVCIGVPVYADLDVQAPATTTADVESTFTVPFTVRNNGNRAATAVTLDVMLGTNLFYQGVNGAGVSCAVQGASVLCTLNDVGAGETRVVGLQVRGTQMTQYNLRAAVRSEDDHLVDDNEISYQLNLRAAVDVAVTISASPASVYVGEPMELTVEVTSTRSQTARGARLQIGLSGFVADSVVAGANSCVSTFNLLSCDLVDLAPGASTRVSLITHSDTPKYGSPTATLQLTGDGDAWNNHEFVNVSVRPEQEVGIEPARDDRNVVVGTTVDIPYTITAHGRVPAPDVRFRLERAADDAAVIEAITTSAGTCGAPSPTVECSLGAMNPGDVRTVTVRVRIDHTGTSYLTGTVLFVNAAGQTQSASNFMILYCRIGVDVAANGTASSLVNEGETGIGAIYLVSQGVNEPQNVVATLDVPSGVSLTEVSSMGPGVFTCVLLSPQRARCSGSFSGVTHGQNTVIMSYRYVSDVPADYQASVTVTAQGDAVPANNDTGFIIRVVPYLDAGITSSEAGARLELIVGEWRTVNVNVTTAARPVPGLRVVAADQFSPYEVDMAAAGYPCTRVSFGMQCDLGDQPANANLPVTVRYRATRGNSSSSLTIGTQTDRDSNHANNTLDFSYQTMARADVVLSVAQASVTGTQGRAFSFPRISVSSPTDFAWNVVVEVPLPAFATIQSVSSTGLCSGAAILRCDFGAIVPGGTETIDINLTGAASGTFDSNITVRAANDSAAGNNAAAVNVRVNAAQGGSSGGGGTGGGGGSGGGGALEWLSLTLMSVLLARRARVSTRTGSLKN